MDNNQGNYYSVLAWMELPAAYNKGNQEQGAEPGKNYYRLRGGKGMIYDINRKEYKRLKTIDHIGMQEYLMKVYEAGWEKGHEQGKAAGAFVTKESVREALKEVKGIGENRTNDIISALAHKKLIDGLGEIERLPEKKGTRLYTFGKKGGGENDR